MSAKYSDWALEDLREEAERRGLRFDRAKDGVKTLASRLRRNDRRSTGGESSAGEGESMGENKLSEEKTGLSFEQQVQLMELERKIRREEREAEEKMRREERDVEEKRRETEERMKREEREAMERVAQIKLETEKLRWESERQVERERMELEMKLSESALRKELEEMEKRIEKKYGKEVSGKDRTRNIKIREMRDGEDIDDYFRIFEMTARAQFLPEKDWIGNLIPKLTEKAKSAYLEIPEPTSQDYEKSKSVIIKAYQLTADHYRYRFRTSQKNPDEDFVQWGNRTRRYLNRWMTVAEAIDDKDKILEQVVMERLLDAVSPELRSWLKDQKPKTAEELGNLANLHVQSRKGPLVAGRYVSYTKPIKPEDRNKPIQNAEGPNVKPVTLQKPESPSPVNVTSHRPPTAIRPPFKCYKCGKEGHMSFNCNRGRGRPAQGYLLCTTPLKSHYCSESPGCFITGKIEGRAAVMMIDSGCSKTLIHEKFLNWRKPNLTGENITVLTATGERVTVPLAVVTIESPQGIHKELVGVTAKLPVDCLLGRSSFGQTLSKRNVLDQWEKNISLNDGVNSDGKEEALVVTRKQAAEMAQRRVDELVDRENELSQRSLSKPARGSNGLMEGDLLTLFKEDEGMPVDNITCEKETKGVSSEIPINILDRNTTQLITDQQKDITLDKILKQATSTIPEKEGYYYDRGILMHRKLQSELPNTVRNVDRIVPPEAYRSEILRVAHTIPLAGHMGIRKTLDRITMHFFWPGVRADVKNYCATCPQCQLVTRKMKADRAPLRPTEVICDPFRKIAIDIVGELPKSSSGYKYILTIVDYATRYPEAIPLRSINSKVIADALIQFFSRVGIPEELVSDQGSNFISTLMTQLYESLGITKIKTSVYHPEGNGLVERFNGTLKAMLKKFAGENVRYWDKYLPYLLFSYREVPSESTGYSPFELMYGRTIRGPLAVIKETWMENDPNKRNLTSYVLEMRRKLATMQEVVQKNLEKTQAKQKQMYDKQSSRRKLDVRDKVLVLLPTPGSKLEEKWQGPYLITKELNGGLNYELDTGKSVKRYRTYHINLLRKWQSKDEIAALVMPESPSSSLPHESNVPPTYDKEDWRDVEISQELNEQQTQQVSEILEEYSDVLSGIPNTTNAAVHQIETGDAQPIRCTPYKIPQKLEEEVNKEIQKMLALGIIRPSTSAWASPVVIVPKSDGSIRFCVDYRKLNDVTKMDAYPIPSMERMIEKIAGAKFITTLDLTKGYWQIPLEDSTIEKSAFIAGGNLYEFVVMPFGMKTAPASFQRMMSEVILKDFDFADAYIDDVEIDTASTFEQHLIHLRQVLQRLRESKLNARPSKCKVAMKSVEFVGHKVGGDKIEPRKALVEAIERFPRPQTKKQVKSFIGLAGYYRKFVPNFSERAAVLTDLTKGRQPTKIVWKEQHENAFQDLKNALKTPPVLRPPHWNEPFILQADASNHGLGAILSQKDEDGQERPVAYASRKLQPREERLSTTEKECLSIVWAVETFRYYLYGRKFTLQTDHNPLVWLNRVRDKSQKLLRWSVTLQEFDMEIEHKPGKRHLNVDALSRVPKQ
jgi:transposase InsO family protein